jgi:hypothetical protein
MRGQSLSPRQVQMEKLSPLGDLTDAEFAELEELLAAMLTLSGSRDDTLRLWDLTTLK